MILGCQEDQDPYRSELGGQLGLAAFISTVILSNYFKTTVTLACDGLSTLNQLDINSAKIKAKIKT